MTTNIYHAHFISAREARKVAQALKNAGYKTANRENCREYVMNVANYFEPGDITARQKVINIICRAAQLQPLGE